MPTPKPRATDWKARLPLAATTPFTLQDFPGRSACILWFSGCQMRCPYCHNPDFALGLGPRINVDTTLDFLRRRRSYLDGVTFSGGECLLSSAVEPMIAAVRELGYAIKIDTNGGMPDRLARLLEAGMVDYVAMDFKSPLDEYERITQWSDIDRWERCLRLLQASAVAFELRTTVHIDLLDEAAIDRMLDQLTERGFRGVWYLQHFQPAPRTLGAVGPPCRRFDLGRIRRDRPFEIRYRNFTAREVGALATLAPRNSPEN